MSRMDDDRPNERVTRSSRYRQTERLEPEEIHTGEPIGQDWRRSRGTTRQRRSQGVPASAEEFIIWLQGGGWKIVASVAAVVVLILVGLILIKPSKPLETTESSVPESGVGANQTLLATTVPTVTLTPVTPTAAPQTGAQFRVFNTDQQGLFLRPEPNTNQPPLKTLPDGTVVTIVGEDFSGPDFVWKHVRDPEGAEGWVARDFLQPVQ